MFIAVITIIAACKAKKEVATASSTSAVSSKTTLLKSIRNQQVDFNTLSIKAKASLSIDNKDNDVSMNIRIKKDELIWINVIVFPGIEVARALITPDSIKIMNKVENEYTAKPFSFIHEFANEQINFKTLQAMLIGNCDPEFISERGKNDIGVLNSQPILVGNLNGLAYRITFNPDYKVAQTNLNDDRANQNLTAAYSDFHPVSDLVIPHSIGIQSMANNKNVGIDLKYNQVGVNEILDFPFSVPKRFTVKN